MRDTLPPPFEFDLDTCLKPAGENEALCSLCALKKPFYVRRRDRAGVGLWQCVECYRGKGTGDQRGEHPVLLQRENNQGVPRG